MKKLTFLLSALITLNSHAYDATQGALQNSYALCGYGYNPSCDYNGQRPPKKIIQYVDVYVPSKYGAFAMNPKSGIGSGVLNKDSLAEAKREAIKACEQGGRNKPCVVKQWVRNGCIASAKGRKTSTSKLWYAVYAAEKRGEAEYAALQRCKKNKLVDCQISLPEGCSMPDGF